MAQWGKKDQPSDAPKWLSEADGAKMQNNKDNAVLIDTEEAAEQGLTGGWTLYKEYGNGRKYIETLVAMRVSPEEATPDPIDPEGEP